MATLLTVFDSSPMTVKSAPCNQLLVGNFNNGFRAFIKTGNRIVYLNGAADPSGIGYDLVSFYHNQPCRPLRKGESVLIEGD